MPRKSASKKQRGGSLASNRVMKNLDSVAATHDYVVSPRIRTKSNFGNTNTYELTGGACGTCEGHKKEEFGSCGGSTTPTQSGGGGHKKEEFGSCGGSTTPTQSGGARRRRSNKSRKSSGKNRKSLRKSSGKNRKSLRKSSGKNRKTSGKTRKQRGGQPNQPTEQKLEQRKNNRQAGQHNRLIILKTSKKNNVKDEPPTKLIPQKGGGSAWMASQYSHSLSRASHDRSGQFSNSTPVSRKILMNPPNMGLAGSGFGSTFDTNAPANLK